MKFVIRLETDKQLGSFTMPQFLPSNHNHSQVLPQTTGFRTPEEMYLLLETVSLKFRAKAQGGSQSCFSPFSGSRQASWSLFSITSDKWTPVTFFGVWWLLRHFCPAKSAGGWGWALNVLTGCFFLGNACGFCQILPFLRPWRWYSLAPLGSWVI